MMFTKLCLIYFTSKRRNIPIKLELIMSSCKGKDVNFKINTHNTTKIKASIYNLKRNKYLKKHVMKL